MVEFKVFTLPQLQISTSSDILSRIIDASPETIEQIEALLQSSSESMSIISPTPPAAALPVNPVSNPDQPEKQQPEPSIEAAEPSEKEEPSQPSKKKVTNWDADRLLSEYFAQPVRFITYTGIKDLSRIQMKSYRLRGIDTNRDRIQMAKLHILFAFPAEKMSDLKPYVKVRTPLKAQNLQPIEDPNERFHVDDELLKQAKEKKSNVNVVTRAGYVLNGCIQHFDQYVLYMRVGEEIVVVYRHGLFEFTIGEQED